MSSVKDVSIHMGESLPTIQDIVQLARLAVSGDRDRGAYTVRRLARKYRTINPPLAQDLVAVLRTNPTRQVALGEPVDTETRLSLVREESIPVLDNEPIWDASTAQAMHQLVCEHSHVEDLLTLGLTPTRTALFVGPPGVGKTLAARWIARELGLPLLVLDLSSVMSSFLGKTGVNLRRVLDYAKSRDCVLFLDELDAIAKRRDDITEIGELKRLVNVLLQEIDSWPDGGLLVAATNHSELLDPAVWRRFEIVTEFPRPAREQAYAALAEFLQGDSDAGPILDILATVYSDTSYSDIERLANRARRAAAIRNITLAEALADEAKRQLSSQPSRVRVQFAAQLLATTGLSQRKVSELTGVSRDTLRKYLSNVEEGVGDD